MSPSRRLVLIALAASLVPAALLARYDHDARAASWKTVWAVGDGADGGPASRAVEDLVTRSGRVDRFLYLGDVYPTGTRAQFTRDYRSVYGRLARVTDPTPGNHEWPRREQGYDAYWRTVTGREPPAFYSVRVGGWQLLGLNSQSPHGAHSRQVRWLRNQTRAPGTCRIAFWHRPRFSAAPHVPDQPDVAPLWRALRGHAVAVLNGHAHDMQRFHPVDGITEFVDGAGGHRLHAVNSSDPRLAFSDDHSFGALRLRLRPGLAEYAFVDAAGRTLDSGHLACSATARPRA
jgi:acid phosphatase type 7